MLALSSAFPQTCKRIRSTIKSFSPFAHGYYILGRHPLKPFKAYPSDEPTLNVSSFLSSALRYPITNLAVLETLYKVILPSNPNSDFRKAPRIELPKRLFRSLGESDATRDLNSDPLPMLRFLWEDHSTYFPKPNAGSHGEYPLVRAVHAEFIPLVKFLLDHGAHPGWRDCLAIRVAIGKKHLKLVKMLFELEKPDRWGNYSIKGKGYLLDVAVKCNARDIVNYLMEEKKCVPQIRTLRSRHSEYSL